MDYSQHLLSSSLTPRFGELHSIYRSRSCGETILPLNSAEPHDSKSVIFLPFGGESPSFWTKYAEAHFLFSSHLPIFILRVCESENERIWARISGAVAANRWIVEERGLRRMDAELWAARLAAAKRQHSLHHSQPQFDRLSIDDFEVDEDVRPDFSCPYCFDDYDIASLCSHLEDEHPFESKAAVCPVCTLKVGRDMLNHITTQHGHLFKIQRRRRLRRVAVPHSSTLSLLSRELREAHLQVLLGGGALRSGINSSSTIADSLLSSLVLNFPGTEAEEISKSAASIIDAKSAKSTTISQQWKACNEPSLSSEERAQKIKQATLRANFVQQLVMSTLLADE